MQLVQRGKPGIFMRKAMPHYVPYVAAAVSSIVLLFAFPIGFWLGIDILLQPASESGPPLLSSFTFAIAWVALGYLPISLFTQRLTGQAYKTSWIVMAGLFVLAATIAYLWNSNSSWPKSTLVFYILSEAVPVILGYLLYNSVLEIVVKAYEYKNATRH